MGTDTRIEVIGNPTAGRGRAARHLLALGRALAKRGLGHRLLQTERAGDATRLAILARDSGARAIVVVGGDGTLNEVSQAYVDERGEPVEAPPVALLCAGSGDDFGRAANGLAPEAITQLVERLVQLRTRPVDIGLLSLRDDRGGEVRRTFVNIASVGVSGHVDQLVARQPRFIGRKATYALASLRALFAYRNVSLELRLDGRPWYHEPTYLAAIANGRFFGGGYEIAPNARNDDGLLDVVCLADYSRREALSLDSKLRRGEHLRDAKVHTGQARQIEVITERPILVDVDGETPGFSPLSARVVAGAMRWIVD